MTVAPDEHDARESGAVSDGTEPLIEDVAEVSPEDARVAKLLEQSIDVPVLARAVEQQEAADAADTLEQIEDDETTDVLVEMDERAAAEALSEMEAPLACGVIEDLRDEGNVAYAARLLTVMAPDDAADLIQEVDDDLREQLYAAMHPGPAADLRRLVGYDEDSAGGLMTTDFLALNERMTVGQATEVIRAGAIPEDMHDLPVIDDGQQLVGVITLRSLLLSPTPAIVSELMDGAARAIRAGMDREEVAREFDRYDLFMLPVVDDTGRLLGIVTVDDVIDIIREEQTEDVQKTVGAGAEEAVYSPISEKFRGRFPWLVTSLVLTCFAVIVVAFFEELIQEHPFLAVLLPLIAALVGNAGHQALAVTLRGIVLDEVRRERVAPLVLREAAVGLLDGAALGLVMCGVVALASLWFEGATWRLGVVAASSLAASMCAGTLAGSGIPLLMRRLGADPAQSSAIFLIMITDALAFATFLGLAHMMAGWLGQA